VCPSARQDDVRTVHFSTATTTFTSISATSATRSYHLHVILVGFYSSHSIRAIMTLQLRGDVSSSDSTFDLFSSLTVYGASAVTVGDVRVYLVGYIFCVMDCHICRDIFSRMDIMYCRLPYVFRCALSLKTIVLYIYCLRGTIQYNKQSAIIAIYSSTLSLGTYGTLFQGYDSNVRTNNKELCTRRMRWPRFSLQDESMKKNKNPTAIRHYVETSIRAEYHTQVLQL
jgi:hypothetical protein